MKKIFAKMPALLLALLFTLQIVPMTAYADDAAAPDVPDVQEMIAQMSDEASDSGEAAAIVCEDVSARTANEKQYLLEDGSYMLTQYDVPVHYENEDGELVDIDNTLTYEAAENAQDFDGYTNEANSFSVKFADDADERIFNFTDEGYTIGMELADGAAESAEAVIEVGETAEQAADETVEESNARVTSLDKLTSRVTYVGALSGADLEYTVLPNGIKEDIVVTCAQSAYTYTFVLNADNLSAVQNDDGSISFVADEDGKSEEKYHIPAPYMIDANNQISYDVSYGISADGEGRYILTVSADKDWINDTDTVFPVRIDPSIMKSYSSAFIDDAYIFSGARYTDTNGSTGPILFLGKQPGMGYARSFYKIDLASIPDGAEKIRSAKLHLDMRLSDTSRNDISIVCKRPLEEWEVGTVTWNNQPELDSSITDYEVFASDAETLDIDITKPLAHDYYNETELGFALMCENETESLPTLVIGGSRHTYAEYQPSVEIVYNKQKGLDTNQMYLPIDCGQYGRAYINAYNGDVTYIHKIFDSDTGLVKMNCVYNQYMANADYEYENIAYNPENVSYGKNWKLMPMETVIPITENELGTQTMTVSSSDSAAVYYGYAYIYNDMYGNNIFLTAAGNDGLVYTFKDQSGRDYTLNVTRANDAGTLIDTGYSLTTPDGTVKYFNTVNTATRKKGYISASVKDGLVTAYSYDNVPGKLSAVNSSGDTKPVTPLYNTVGDKDYISSVAYNGVNKANFTYEGISGGNTNIAAIQNVGVGRAMFGYNGSGKLLTVREADGARLNFEYNSYGNLTAVVWKKNSSAASVRIEFSYDLATTDVHFFGEDAIAATEDDIIVRYQFDPSGKSLGAFSMTADGRIHERTIDTSYDSFESIVAINAGGAYAHYMEKDVTAALLPNYDTRLTTIELSTDESYRGASSYKVRSTRRSAYLTKTVTLASGEHTFSAYVKCTTGMKKTVNDVVNYYPITISAYDSHNLMSSGSFADVTVTDENIAEHMTPESSAAGSRITKQRIYMTDADVNNGWQKITCTFNIGYDADNIFGAAADAPAKMELSIGTNCSGTFYADEIMLDGQLLSWYKGDDSIISSGFEISDIYWETGNCPYKRVTKDADGILLPDYLDSNKVYSPENVLFGDYSFMIEGDPDDDDKALYHTEYLNATEVEDYKLRLSGWGKANSLPISGPDAPQGFELFAYYVYYVTTADGTSEMRTASTAIPFNWQIDDWQYVSKELNLPTAGEGETISKVYSVTFGVLYKGNRNTAYFDNVELAYVYDD